VNVFDPLATLPLAEVRRETATLLPPSRPADARRAGWLPHRGGEPLMSRGRSSELVATLLAPRPLTLAFRCTAVDGADAGPRRLHVAVNGSPAGEVELDGGDQRLPLPPELLRAGVNRVRFDYPWLAGRRRGSVRDALRGVDCDHVRLQPMAAAAATPRRLGNRLELPPGTAVDWYFVAPGAAVLELPSVAGPASATLRVVAQVPGEEEQELAVVEPGGHRRWIELPEAEGGVRRLSLAAVPTAAGAAAAGPSLRVTGMRVLGRRGSPPPPPAGSPLRGASPAAAPGAGGPRPSILLYVADTLRADRLGAYEGSRRGLTPALDRFAEGATVFRRAFAQAPWTRPSVAGLLTGLPAQRHGVTRLEHRLPAAVETLAERLAAAGYRTAAVSTNAHVTRGTGMAQGFQHFAFLPDQAAAAEVHRAALDWLDRRAGEGPWLLYLHVLEPHAPYTPPPDLRARLAPQAPPGAGSRAWLERLYRARGAARREMLAALPPLYDGEVAALDRAFGALRGELERRGAWDPALVVFVADHGEALGERGVVGHAQDLYQEALAVPLVVKAPGQRQGTRVAEPVHHTDVVPTLLAAAGLPAPPDLPGVDLLAGPPPAERALPSQLDYGGRRGAALVWGRWKWIAPETPQLGSAPELYDLLADPRERHDLAATQPVIAGWLRTLLRAERLAGAGPSERAQLDAETRAALAALGYL
jgi:arylsulfatase A-like enzyme